MTRHSFAVALLGAALLAGCDENEIRDITGPVAATQVRFFNFGVNAPSVNFYANTQKLTAILSGTGVEAITGVAYGGVGNASFYSALDPGQYTLAGKISATVDKDLAIATATATLADGKKYSFYMSGFYNTTTKTVEAFVVEDEFPATYDYSTANVRFVNAISNSSPMTLYAKNTTTSAEQSVGGLVAYKAAGTFVAVPPGTYDLNARLSGSTANAISRTAVSFSAGKYYTIGARGDMTVTSTTATNRPFLDNTANR